MKPRELAWRVRRLLSGEPLLHDYTPVSMLRNDVHEVAAATVPAIDAHNHLGRWLTDDGSWQVSDVGALIAAMDQCNIAAMVNLDGRWGQELRENLDRYDHAYPGRFATFCHVDWSLLATASDDASAIADLERSLRQSVAEGARGLKVWKDLGLDVRDRGGNLVLPDDARLEAIWATAGELEVPVLIHVGNPRAFYEPVDIRNERLEELRHSPDLRLADKAVPPLDRLLDALDAVVGAHPRTRFIGAHVAGSSEQLAWVDSLLRRHTNLWVDTAGRMAELGRQPRATRRLLGAHPTRVIWGSDVYPPSAEAWRIAFRFLETEDEHFPYAPEQIPPQGRWAISGLGLDDELLARVYRDNALAVIPGLTPAGGSSAAAPRS